MGKEKIKFLSYNLSDDELKAFEKIKKYELFMLTEVESMVKQLDNAYNNACKWNNFYTEITKMLGNDNFKVVEREVVEQQKSSQASVDKLKAQYDDALYHYTIKKNWYEKYFENLPIEKGCCIVDDKVKVYCLIQSEQIEDNWEDKVK